jgi:hypothetical protein
MVEDDTMYLFSRACKLTTMEAGVSCGPCAALARNTTVQGILDRMSQGTHKGTTYAYLGINDLIRSLNAKSKQNDYLRLNALNQTRMILRKTSMLSDYKRLVVAVSTGSVARVDTILHVALKQKRGIVAALEQVKAAAIGVYKVKSFTEQERMLAMLLWRLGGDRVGHIAQCALGTPSVGTLRDGSVQMPIIPSAGTPTIETIARNTRNVLAKVVELLKGAGYEIEHAVLMVDELATEKRLRYHWFTNESWDCAASMPLRYQFCLRTLETWRRCSERWVWERCTMHQR